MTTLLCSLRFKSQIEPDMFRSARWPSSVVYYAPKYSYTIVKNAIESIGVWQYTICNIQRVENSYII